MLSDCVIKDASVCEVFMVQEDFAVIAKAMRDRLTHAVLPIGSTILKIDSASVDEVLDDRDVLNIVACLGVGFCATEEVRELEFSLAHLRYGKVIIAMDA